MAKAKYNKAYKKEPEKVIASAILNVNIPCKEIDNHEWFIGDKVELVKRTDFPESAGIRYRIKGTIQWVKESDLANLICL